VCFDCELREVLFHCFVCAFHWCVAPRTTSASAFAPGIVILLGLIREL
jgi:hypothetical protein